MEANDSEMEKYQNNCTRSETKNKNDPWKPVDNKASTLPTLLAAPQDPLRDMISSETYVKSLEKKLNKIKGKTDQAKPKDMIQSLHEARDLHSSQFISDTAMDTYREDLASDSNASLITSIQRKLNPERQAISTQELVPLVHEDFLAKTLAEQYDKEGVDVTLGEGKT